MRKLRGYTLIEVLIVIAILAAVILMAAPLSGTWTAQADTQQVEGQLKEAISRAKSLAQRNQMVAQGTAPVAAVCLDNRVLTVRKGAANTPPRCGANATGDQVWRALLGGNVPITLDADGTEALACVCFDNKGLVTTSSTCDGCAPSTTLTLNGGTSSKNTLQIY